jgi:predicted nucleotidyltransferase
MDRQAILDRLRENQRQLRARGVLHAALFGSRARQDARPDSDTDILVELDPDRRLSVYEYVGLKEFVATLIDGPVDVVAREYLKTPLRAPTAADAIYAF